MSENNQNHEQNAIENLNDRLTTAGERVANNKKIIYWCLGIVAVCAVFAGSYFWIYRNPGLNNSWAAYNKVEQLAMGNDTVRAREYVKVADKYAQVLEAQAKMLLGDSYVNVKKYDDALSAYNSCIRTAKANPQIVPIALWKSANVYDEQKQYAKALDCYKQIREEYPQFQLGNGMSIDAYIAREETRLGK